MDSTYPYIASLTREPFLFYEMRTTARLICEGLEDVEVVSRIAEENLFQYPTEKTISRIATHSGNFYSAYRCGKTDLSVCNDETKPPCLGIYDYSDW